jgi:hypothetical protein
VATIATHLTRLWSRATFTHREAKPESKNGEMSFFDSLSEDQRERLIAYRDIEKLAVPRRPN